MIENNDTPYEPSDIPLDEGFDPASRGDALTPVDAPVTGRSTRLEELRAMEIAYGALEPLPREAQARAFTWLAEAMGYLDFQRAPSTAGGEQEVTAATGPAPSPRDFISQKKPTSLVERIACLAYYLTHFRDTHHFKTADITALNTEAAQPKFGNPTRDMDHADRQSGYIVAAGNGVKQLTARGEAVVAALPDREAVKQALLEHPYKATRYSGAKTAARGKEEQ